MVRKRRRKKLPVPERLPLVRPDQPNEGWSMDFVFDELASGRRVKTLTVVDDCSKAVVQIAVDTSIPALYVTRVLDQVKAKRGLPRVIRTDNGPEFAGRTMQTWAAKNGVELRFIQPGKPVQNAYIEGFNSRFRDECLSQHWFANLSHMRSVIDNWREDYNHHRPHSTLGHVPPAVFAARCRQHAGGNAPNPASTTTMQTPGLQIEVLRILGAAQVNQGGERAVMNSLSSDHHAGPHTLQLGRSAPGAPARFKSINPATACSHPGWPATRCRRASGSATGFARQTSCCPRSQG